MDIKNSIEVLASAARTATPTVPAFDKSGVGISTNDLEDLQIIIDVTALSLTPSVQPAFQGFDVTSGKWYDLIAAITAITAVGTTVISYGKNTPIVANASNQGMIPSKIRLTLTHADTDSITYSVGVNTVTKP